MGLRVAASVFVLRVTCRMLILCVLHVGVSICLVYMSQLQIGMRRIAQHLNTFAVHVAASTCLYSMTHIAATSHLRVMWQF